MCGFIAVYGRLDIQSYKPIIQKSLKLIKHRGPDDKKNIFLKNFVAGFQRLSIQDLSKHGQQPMQSFDKRYTIIFNGEIYNFKKIRETLVDKGYKFRSASDTEVLLYSYIEFKENCLEYLEGMFAFAVYDNLKKTFFVARDRFGIKPLYYILTDKKKLIISSEIKAFIPFVKKENLEWDINKKKINEQIKFRCLAGDETLITGVKKLNPGEYIKANLEQIYFKKFFQFNNLKYKDSVFTKDKNVAIDTLDQEIESSVLEQSISDAPIGVALSGGLDSSLIVNYLNQQKKNVKTYSINFENDNGLNLKIDEGKYINYIRKKYSTIHKKTILTEKKYKELFLKCVWHNEEPINFPHTPGIYLLSELAKKDGTKVLLGGEGADEFFGGYPNFLKEKLNTNYFDYTRFNKKNSTLKNFSNYFKYRKSIIKQIKEKNSFNKKIIYSLSTYLQSIENRLDKMSMGNGIEFRVPFIKKKILELSLQNNLYSLHQSKKYTKVILRKVAEKYFSKEHIYRNKIGFSTPINRWMRNKKGFGEVISILSEKKTLERGIYDSSNIIKLLNDFYKYPDEKKIYSNAGKVWNLLNLEVWIRTMIEKKSEL